MDSMFGGNNGTGDPNDNTSGSGIDSYADYVSSLPPAPPPPPPASSHQHHHPPHAYSHGFVVSPQQVLNDSHNSQQQTAFVWQQQYKHAQMIPSPQHLLQEPATTSSLPQPHSGSPTPTNIISSSSSNPATATIQDSNSLGPIPHGTMANASFFDHQANPAAAAGLSHEDASRQFINYQASVSDLSSRPTSSDENWQYAAQLPPSQAFAQDTAHSHFALFSAPQTQALFAAAVPDFANMHHHHAQQHPHHHAHQHHHHQHQPLDQGHRNSYASSNASSSSFAGPLQHFSTDLNSNLANYVQISNGVFADQQLLSVSPQETALDNLSASSPSDSGWQLVEAVTRMTSRPSAESFLEIYNPVMGNFHPGASIANPGETLHIRSSSNESSTQDHESNMGSNISIGSFDNIDPFVMDTSSPETSHAPLHRHYLHHAAPQQLPQQMVIATSAIPGRRSIDSDKGASSPTESAGSTSPKSPASAGSFNARKRKSIEMPSKPSNKKGTLSQRKDAGGVEKKIGRRKGPLRPEQRKQAGEIRKLRACLRCRFLKKTCDTGDPCTGCQPSHARLWQVPCTRIDIRDLHYFVKAFRDVDFERHVKPGTSGLNIVGFGEKETSIYITHGFGYVLPIQAREIMVRDMDALKADWVETDHEKPIEFEVDTMSLTVSPAGLTVEMAQQYLDKHITEGWDTFVDKHFQGTPFWSEMLKTVHSFWCKTKHPILKAALDMILAYNLTQHICWAEGIHESSSVPGKVVDPDSSYRGSTVAPVFINFHIKHVLAQLWRNAQQTVLEKLSELWSSFYTGEKAKNWPIILTSATVLLMMWEEMEFDANYRMQDEEAIRKFYSELSSTPVGVIVGLFSAMCQKYPQFADWNTAEHGNAVNNDPVVCSMLEEVRGHVQKHAAYLEDRHTTKFDRDDFDSLSNKYVSRLILRRTP